MRSGTCPKCGSTEILKDERVVYDLPHGPEGIFVVLNYLIETPKSWLGKQRIKNARVYPRAWICTECGYTELFIDDLQTLKEAHEKRRED